MTKEDRNDNEYQLTPSPEQKNEDLNRDLVPIQKPLEENNGIYCQEPSPEQTSPVDCKQAEKIELGDFATFDEAFKEENHEANQEQPTTDAFGDFGTFEESNDPTQTQEDKDAFGDFGTFEEQPAEQPNPDNEPAHDAFGDFGAFDEAADQNAEQTKDQPPDSFGFDNFDNTNTAKEEEHRFENIGADNFGEFNEVQEEREKTELSADKAQFQGHVDDIDRVHDQGQDQVHHPDLV